MLRAHVRLRGCVRRLLIAGVVAMSVRGWAQGPVDGAIRGHVSAVCGAYPQRCAAGEVRVHVMSPDLGVERDVDADSEGDFLLLRLPPGEYELRATSRGEGGRGTEGIAVARLDLEGGDLDDVMLTLGPVRQGAGASLQASVPGLSLAGFGGASYDPVSLNLAKQLDSLPVESRQWEDLVELDSEASEETSVTQTDVSASDDDDDPGSRVSARDGATATGMSYAGLASTQGEFSLDGLSGDQSFRAGPRGSATGGASSGASYNQGSVRSFRVLPRNFSAQYGMVGGMAVVSRAGELGAAWRGVRSRARECVGGDESILDCDALQRWRGDERGGEAGGIAVAVRRVGGIADWQDGEWGEASAPAVTVSTRDAGARAAVAVRFAGDAAA